MADLLKGLFGGAKPSASVGKADDGKALAVTTPCRSRKTDMFYRFC